MTARDRRSTLIGVAVALLITTALWLAAGAGSPP